MQCLCYLLEVSSRSVFSVECRSQSAFFNLFRELFCMNNNRGLLLFPILSMLAARAGHIIWGSAERAASGHPHTSPSWPTCLEIRYYQSTGGQILAAKRCSVSTGESEHRASCLQAGIHMFCSVLPVQFPVPFPPYEAKRFSLLKLQLRKWGEERD